MGTRARVRWREQCVVRRQSVGAREFGRIAVLSAVSSEVMFARGFKTMFAGMPARHQRRTFIRNADQHVSAVKCKPDCRIVARRRRGQRWNVFFDHGDYAGGRASVWILLILADLVP